MKKFNHSRIIKKYSQQIEMSRKIYEGVIVNGKLEKSLFTYSVLAAFKNIKETEIMNNSGFLKGDAKFYAIKEQTETPQKGDMFTVDDKEFVLVNPNNYDIYTDYHYFIARRVVNNV